MAQKWLLSDIPDMTGKIAVITGGNTGLGLKTAMELSRRGVEVVIGSRSTENGEAAVASVLSEVPAAKISHSQLELTNHESIAAFAMRFLDEHDRLDILLNNAGLVMHPRYERAETGRELQMQINHLGHFALAARLMPLLRATAGARLVQSTTVPYQKGDINFDDFDWTKRKYQPMQSYFDSRLAQLLFAHKLNTELARAGLDTRAISMQPGLVATEGLKTAEASSWWMRALAQPLEKGCRTHLRSCTDPAINGDHFWEPRFVVFGEPMPKKIKPQAQDMGVANRLIAVSEELSGVSLSLS